MMRHTIGSTTHSTSLARRARVRASLVAAVLLACAACAPAARAQQDSAASPAIAEAYRLADGRQLDRAAAVLRGRLAEDSTDVEARSLLARVLSWDRHFPESLEQYRLLLEHQPDRAADRARYARVLTWSGRIEQSLGEYRRALAEDSSDVETWIDYARALSWIGDLPGAAMEYRNILAAHPSAGDAWLGYATVARWRAGATASDRFLGRAEAHGAERGAAAEERAAVRQALAPALGGGWIREQERQYVAGPDFTLESSGPFTRARLTVGRTADVNVRAAWVDQRERSESGGLNYDVDTRMMRADVSLLRGYPLQASASLEARHLSQAGSAVTYPLLGSGDFLGWSLRSWGYLGRFTPAAGVRRDFVPIKQVTPVNELIPGHQTIADGTLAWQWSARGTATTGVERGSYSDGNVRRTGRLGAAYRVRIRQPGVALDYGFAFTDFDSTSASYFTPLEGARHHVGIGLEGYRARLGISYGARYEFSRLGSDNFPSIRAHTWSARVNAADLGPVGLGLEGAYSHDNHDYETWSIGLHAAAHW